MSHLPQHHDLVSIAQHWARARGDDCVFSYSLDGETETERLTFAQLDARARAIAATLQAAGAQDRTVMLIYAGDAAFFAAFLGCLYARVVAVPIPVGRTLAARVAAIVDDCAPVLALSTEEHAAAGRMAFALHPKTASIPWLATDAVAGELAGDWRPPRIDGATLAYLQYTSGSTAEPKGVMVSHGNILANLRDIHQTYAVDDDSISVSWLPHFHDMGLIQGYLEPVFAGRPSHVFPPKVFVKQPHTWLRAISRHRATHSGAPNFAFQLCVDAISPAARDGLDLSSWRAAYTGAEPVQPASLAAFAGAFAPHGFRAAALRPCYGLAEATLLVTSSQAHYTDSIRQLDRAALEAHRVAPARPGAPSCAVVGCGPARGETSVAIVDPVIGERLADGDVGEIWISGPGVSSGYWERDDLNDALFRARLRGDARAWLRSGDLGFIQQGELYITGRVDDLIIVYGRNLYPNDIELTVLASHPALGASGAAVFGFAGDGGTRIGVAAELRREVAQGFDGDAIAAAIRQAVGEHHEVQVDLVALLPPGRLPRTTSGKPRRSACRQALLAGELPCLYQSRSSAPVVPEGIVADLAASLRQGTREAAESLAIGQLRRFVAPAVGVAAEQLAAEITIAGLGLDSLQQVQLRNRIEVAFGLAVPFDLSHMTLRRLAGELVERARAPEAPGEPEPTPAGPVPLSPVHSAFLAGAQEDIDHCNLSMMLEASAPVSALVAAATAVVSREESLALRFAREAGEWVQRYAGPPDESVVSVVDMTGVPAGKRSAAIERHAADVQTSLDVGRGPLFRAVVYDHGPGVAARLLVVGHWLAVDALSMKILFDRIQAAVDREMRGEPTGLRARPASSFVQWARRRAARPGDEQLEADLAWWSEAAARVPPWLPVELEGANDFASSREVTSILGAAQTASLLAVAASRGATPADLLAAAYARAVAFWAGHPRALVAVTTHGRDEASAGLVGRIAGWFPALIEVGRSASGRAALDDVLLQLRAIPHGGATFAELCATAREPARSRLAPLAHPELQLDYLGGLYEDVSERSLFRPARERSGPDFSRSHERPFTLRLSGFTMRSQLSLTLDYSTSRLRPETAEALLQAIRGELLGFLP